MLRKITPFLILSISCIFWAIYMLLKESNLGMGLLAVITAFIIGIVLFGIDYGLKKWINNYKKTFLIQLTIVLIAVFIYKYQFRTKTLIIPTDFDKDYVTIIYGVENAKDLSISPITWNKKIEIPESGILLTSSDFNENLRETDIKMVSGIYLNSDQTDKGFVQMSDSEFDFNGKTYQYRIWKIQSGFCCFYSSEDAKKYRKEIETEYKKIKASR